jgi:hypothetical protein
MAAKPWWRCPNDPPCPHGGVLHDIYDLEDTVPRCCAEGCDCGMRIPQSCGCVTASGRVVRECGSHPVIKGKM